MTSTSTSISISILTPTSTPPPRLAKRKAGDDEESKEEKEVDSPSSPQKKEKKDEKEKERDAKMIAIVWAAVEQNAKEERASGKQRAYLYDHNCERVGTGIGHDWGKVLLGYGEADALVKLRKLDMLNVDALSCDDFDYFYGEDDRSIVDDCFSDDETLRKRAAKCAVKVFADKIFGGECGVREYALTTV